MFVYPYDYPADDWKNEDSWLVHNLWAFGPDSFHIGALQTVLPPKRIRIAADRASDLKIRLEQGYHLTQATVYVDYAQAKID